MRNILLLLLSIIFLSGCSTGEDNGLPDNYFYLNVNGQDANSYGNGNNLYGTSGGNIIKKNDFFTVIANYGQGFEFHLLTIIFTADGKLISIKQESNSVETGQWNYYNFRDFPSNYFNIDILSINESSTRIKAKLTGKIYLEKSNLNSEYLQIDADIDGVYSLDDNSNVNYLISTSDTHFFSMEQYCTATLNNLPWIARHEHTNGLFSSVDPYRIEVHFDNNATTGSFPVSSAVSANYLKFSKFSTTTLTYDDYNVTGNVAYTYKEFHGNTNYSFIGTFSFTAVNPNNPSDVITVTDGKFRSYQQF